jgi:alpha-methylacyl-CoA racemase
MSGGPLKGLRVVEITGFGPGPMAGMLLADHGAEVVRIERPAGHDAGFEVDGRYFLHNRGKRRITLDLKKPEALSILLQLIDRADAVIEGFRPGVAERLGFGPQSCHARNPRLVYARVTGWGQTGPYAQYAGHDLNYVASSGALNAIGPPGGAPVPPLNLVADFGGGGLYAVFGILAAIHERSHTGAGQVVDVAMAEGALSLLTSTFGYAAAGIHTSARGSNVIDGGAPHYAVYETADGGYVTVAALEPQFMAKVLKMLGLDPGLLELRKDRARWPEIRRSMAKAFRARTRREWQELLEREDTCFSSVLSIPETADHPQFAARASVVSADGVLQPGIAPRFERHVGRDVNSIHAPDSDTDWVLGQIGIARDDIVRLKARGAVQ